MLRRPHNQSRNKRFFLNYYKYLEVMNITSTNSNSLHPNSHIMRTFKDLNKKVTYKSNQIPWEEEYALPRVGRGKGWILRVLRPTNQAAMFSSSTFEPSPWDIPPFPITLLCSKHLYWSQLLDLRETETKPTTGLKND